MTQRSRSDSLWTAELTWPRWFAVLFLIAVLGAALGALTGGLAIIPVTLIGIAWGFMAPVR